MDSDVCGQSSRQMSDQTCDYWEIPNVTERIDVDTTESDWTPDTRPIKYFQIYFNKLHPKRILCAYYK